MEESAATTPLPRETNSPQKQPEDIKLMKMDDAVKAFF
jgi:hypothetical protein